MTVNETIPNSKIGLAAALPVSEKAMPHGVFRLECFREGDESPCKIIEIENAYVNAGGAALLNLLIGAGGTAFNNANAFIGVGDSSTATTAGMTDLQASTNKTRKAMDASFPSLSGQVMTWRATFATGDANYAWNEIALFNASTGGTMLCRVGGALFTKTSAISVIATYTITVP